MLAGGALRAGRVTREFESAFAEYVGARHAVAVASGMGAFHLAFEVLDFRPGDEVLVSDYGFAAAVAALHRHVRPVLVDIDPELSTLDAVQAGTLVTRRTRAIVPTYLGGAPADVGQILSLAACHRLRVVEGELEVLPGRTDDGLAGPMGDLAVFSLGADGTVTGGQGGMITTDRDDHARDLRERRVLMLEAAAGGPAEVVTGATYAMSDVNAALGLEQLRKLERSHAIRTYYVAMYRLGFADLPELTLPEPIAGVRHPSRLFIVQLDLDRLTVDRETFVRMLHEHHIGVAVPPWPLHVHPGYREIFADQKRPFPNAVRLATSGIALPLHARMTEGDAWRVIHAVRRVVERHRRPLLTAPG